MLTSRMLRQFVAVAEDLNFRKAADRLAMAQSPLSQAIRNLEEVIGVKLFIRNNRSVALTQGGRVFLDDAYRMLVHEERAVARARLSNDEAAGQLAFGFVGSLAYDLLPKLVRHFQQERPQVRLDLQELRTKDQVEALSARRLDVGLIRLPLPESDDLATLALQRDHFVVALPAGHRLADQDQIPLAELADDRFVLFSRKRVPSMYMKVTTACIDAGFHPKVAYEVLEIASAVGVVASGMAVALIPSNLQILQHRDVIYRALAPPANAISLEAALVWRAGDTGPALSQFLAAARSLFAPRE